MPAASDPPDLCQPIDTANVPPDGYSVGKVRGSLVNYPAHDRVEVWVPAADGSGWLLADVTSVQRFPPRTEDKTGPGTVVFRVRERVDLNDPRR